jgi:hypothetical protein
MKLETRLEHPPAIDSIVANDIVLDRVRRHDSHREKMPYARYFQLLGFDVMFDRNWRPWVLEVNYRPSLDSGTAAEKEMKVKLLRDVVAIAATVDVVENHLRETHASLTGASVNGWITRGQTLKDMEKQRQAAVKDSGFVEVLSPRTWNAFVSGLIAPPLQQEPRAAQAPLLPVAVQRAKVAKPTPTIWRPFGMGMSYKLVKR